MPTRRDPKLAPAASKLAAFLSENGISKADAGRALGVTGQGVSKWASGLGRPSPHLRMAIEKWTGGVVAAADWPGDDLTVLSIRKFRKPRKASRAA
jgi:transcriptional regulator with XRE-family HTH domain